MARLTIYIYPPDLEGWDQGWRQHDQTWREQREQQGRAGVGADSGGAGSGAQETRSFILNWRIPGCAPAAAAATTMRRGGSALRNRAARPCPTTGP